MLSFLKEIDTYEITVEPCRSETWAGLFNFEPNAEDVATAIRKTIKELDEDVEHENDMIESLKQTLELVTLKKSEVLGPVHIAGTLVGEISLTIVKIFVSEPQSMMPLPVEEVQAQAQAWRDAIPELTDTSELTDISEVVQARVDAGQFDAELEEHLTTDPRTGEEWPSAKIQTSEGEITLTESQRRNLASEHMRGDGLVDPVTGGSVMPVKGNPNAGVGFQVTGQKIIITDTQKRALANIRGMEEDF